MKRRDFLQAGVAMSIGGLMLSGGAPVEAAARPDLAVVHGLSPEKITRAAVEALGGMQSFISKGDVVVVKPNIGWARTPEQAATTNPTVVATLVQLALEAGAKKVKVFDRTCDDPRRCYVQSGIQAAAKAAGAEVTFVDDRKFRDVKIPGGVAIQSWPLYTELLEADKIINVPIAKHHSLSKLTLAHKNWMGMMGGNRGKIHQQVDDCIVDVTLVIKPCLTVLDAVRILTAHGPQGGHPEDVKKLDTVIAGVNQVSVDAYGTTLFGKKPEYLDYLVKASRRGLGVMDLDKLKIRKLEA